MRRPVRRLRAALAAAGVPEFAAAPLPAAAGTGALAFRPAPGSLPPGTRVYAIGDVHGCADALTRLLAAIRADLAARPAARVTLVLLGDLIDHGPDSAGVIDLLIAGAPVPGAALVTLCGDHERMLLDALAGESAAATDWLAAGGAASLRSWGLPEDLPRAAWAASLPPAQLGFLRGLRLSHRAGDYLFVHAGLRPGLPPARQRAEDLLSIRQPFLSEPADFGVVVVHGHSVSPAPEIAAHRIGLDTGAGLGGALSCAVLEDDRIACLAVAAPLVAAPQVTAPLGEIA